MAKRRTVRPSSITEGPLSPDDDADASGTRGRPSLDEEPSDADVIRFGDDSTRCRRCKTLLYDDLDICPRCAEPVMNANTRRLPLWVIIALGLVLAAMVAPAVLPVILRLL
ncbi:MAG: hypothetical protein KF902_14640 [Phycisphaeraceae bacterium]|nr:hypothetical protein [Phycisphaeraceae bacterium]